MNLPSLGQVLILDICVPLPLLNGEVLGHAITGLFDQVLSDTGQIQAMLSSLPVRTLVPSGLKATAIHRALMRQLMELLAA